MTGPIDPDLVRRYAPPPRQVGQLVMPARERKEPKGLRRGGAVKKENRPRLKARRAESFSDCARMARELPCCVCGREPCQAAHVRSRGAGGKDTANVVPLCARHHRAMDDIGSGVKTFEKRFRLSLDVVASYVLDAVRAHVCTDYGKRAKDGVVCRVCLEAIAP